MSCRRSVVLLPLALAACAAPTPEPRATAMLDEATFRCTVEPILVRECSYTGCHGNAGFPLRVYSIGKLRAGDPRSLDARVQPLTDDERHANYLSALAFASGDVAPDDNLLLRKPMPPEQGGYEHVGGAIFGGPNDPRARALRAWLDGTKAACASLGAGSPAARPARRAAPAVGTTAEPSP